jgi:hypothetical protein
MTDHPLNVSVSLVKYDAARHALAEAKRVDEVKGIRDIAVAMKVYAQQAKDSTLIDTATDLRFRAERRLGEMIAEQKRTVGLRSGARDISKRQNLRGSATALRKDVPTLKDAGIDKKLSSHAQKLAAMPAPEFEAKVEQAKSKAVASLDRVVATAEKKRRTTKEIMRKHRGAIDACIIECRASIWHALNAPDIDRDELFRQLRNQLDEMEQYDVEKWLDELRTDPAS